MLSSQVKFIIFAGCLAAIIPQHSSNALLLGNFMGCNTFHCRLTALETDVAQLKQQVARLSGTSPTPNQQNGGVQPFNNPNQNHNMNPNQQMQNQQINNSQQQQQQGTNNQQTATPSVRSYGLDYPVINSREQMLRRNQDYQMNNNGGNNNPNALTNNYQTNGQFLNGM